MSSLFHLRISNFKKISLIDVDLESHGNHVTIVGKNDSGKTSFLDAISYLFGGAPFKPEQPVRIGAEVCQIMGRLSNGLIFKRRVTDTAEKFTIESEDGMSYKSPQSVSDALWNPIAFEPDAFSRLETKKQAAMLRQITGVDTTLLDSRRKVLYAERTKVNAVYESMAAQVEGIVIPVPPTEVGDEKDIAALAKQRAELAKHNAENAKCRDDYERAKQVATKMADDVARLEKSLEAMRAKLADARKLETELGGMTLALVEQDTDELDQEIAGANAANAVVRGNIQKMNEHKRALEQKEVAEKNLRKKNDEVIELTVQIKKIDADKAAMLTKAKFPVDGMSVEDDEVFVNGVPFSQIASSEQTRIGMAMAMAQKSMQSEKAIKICLIRDGDRIGDEKRAVIQQWAVENSVTIFEERVERPGIVGIEIEDGHLRGVVVNEEDAAAIVAAPDGKAVVVDELAEKIEAAAEMIATQEPKPIKKTRSKKTVEPAVVVAGMLGDPEDPPE